jgi:hypothetical protein
MTPGPRGTLARVSTELQHTADTLIASLREVAQRLDTDTVSRSVWQRESGIGEWHVLTHFESWTAFVEAAGLRPHVQNRRLGDDELFAAMRDAFIENGGIVTRTKFRRVCRHSDDAYAKRWGRWPNVLARFREWALQHDPEFPFLDDLPADAPDAEPASPTSQVDAQIANWASTQRTKYGPFINFRGLQHAPINEQGVVFLFGMVAFDLGYVVEGVGTGFPDCEAKRCVSKSGDVWERVRIEFEYRSRSFRDHGHAPSGCDVIVCWEDTWPDCPVEVLELRTILEDLASEPD